MMEEEFARRRAWVSRADFLDMLGASNLVPGPSSTEMAIHIGHQRAAWRGLLAAGVSFDRVSRLHWLMRGQLLDAVAINQLTPRPLFTTATFIGYLLDGVTGAVVATVGIFLPGFLFVAASRPLIPLRRGSKIAGALLDGQMSARSH